MKILITGGAGYVGTVLLPFLLEQNHEITVYDSLLFGGDQLIPFFKYPNFHFILGDIRNKELLNDVVKNQDIFIHLAAIVGYPACRKNPHLAETTNVDGTINLIEAANNRPIIFASTGSNYGAVEDICTEDTPLNPLSLYGQTKTLAETMLLDKANAVVFRFATAFGPSPRLRLDLMVNDFTYKCISQGYIVVYEKEFKRTFIHVHDMARAIDLAVNNIEKMMHNAYNVGSNSMNYTKQDICDIISSKTGAHIHYADVGEDADKRNYEVSYAKINALGYDTTKNVETGIDELIEIFKVIDSTSKYGNV
ncbi:MAG: SDR family NAD-dependent epimerase/dehydratase [Crenarchaeota archaeon]|nr:MAG: SDR family NAD-dependent epimerase/dehydratase [Thermoproteota archaeon]